ncbi:MAG: tRNA lysidine(34) synthetase TilS [Treponema sp.]|jgi:tRNA(Ile)-lysidine synthase|nr:tRNA lysidine(34) synthetase TilS [Treponema sp.]
MSPFETAVRDGLGTFPAGALFLAAVSGGADSTALLAALASLSRGAGAQGPFALSCLHVEHGIRPAPESRGDADAVRALCARLGVPCTVTHVKRGLIAERARGRRCGLEAAARDIRLRILRRQARALGAYAIVTGHTRDDLLETILMRVLRGASPAGLAPMPVRRGLFLRPLLALNRAAVEAYLREQGLSWQTDSSNADLRFLRNRIRLRLIPLLDEYFPGWRPSVQALALQQGRVAGFLAGEAERRLHWDLERENCASPSGIEGSAAPVVSLPWEVFAGADEALREEALLQGAALLGKGAHKPISRRALTKAAAALARSTPRPCITPKSQVPSPKH